MSERFPHDVRVPLYGMMLDLARQVPDGESRDFGAFQMTRDGRAVTVSSRAFNGWAYDVLASFPTARLDGDWATLPGVPGPFGIDLKAVR